MGLYQEQIDDIMDYFDFSRVAKTMEALDWKWHDPEFGGCYVPEECEIRKKARRLLTALAQTSEYDSTATGGFVVSRTDGKLKLSFNVAEWDCGGY